MDTLEGLLESELLVKAGTIAFTGIAITGGLVVLGTAYLSTLYSKFNDELKEQGVDMDAFCATAKPANKAKVAAGHYFRMGNRKANVENPIALEATKSPHVDGLYVAKAVGSGETTEDAIPMKDLMPKRTSTNAIDKRSKQTIVVATIRMGFGHHRLAYSACSWALSQGYTTIFHDLINIESEEASLIHSVDALYSKFSRLATELGGVVEKLWGKAMKQGDADALRVAAMFANHLQPILGAYPKDIPMICTHQICALVASACGFTNVVNLVVDNYPQWFLVVPKTLNCVQGPVNYQSYIRYGVDPKAMKLAGHWCPQDMIANLDKDSKRRLANLSLGQDKKQPLRLVIPVGGAGAQKTFIVGLIKALKGMLEDGKVQVFLNAGDHTHMKAAFRECLASTEIDHVEVNDIKGVHEFASNLLEKDPKSSANLKPVTLFAFEDYFPAVASTDILCRCSDVLVCKPSELAFYPIPKLHIRRVGDHEADSARRACETGDGSMEAREVKDALHVMQLMVESPDLLQSMNEGVMKNNSIGMYNGCKNAVSLAVKGTM
mmetsp:Transcript_45915/g.111228  ORF Transcript_45915/g.111228 Transcript_45915/m.111228 type:complete len:550 (-) Transcript_45915:495-2144(-)|eukprot:CAMPEP_0113648348 /NCGR_PEP_ID=MMETSP0017_2-20120614/25640_1 /TAXON_ID=2856 /ORGANISM="Cylindrotheca closterium" /LENGTH=549 /DNA_ID=CAMNT_0000560553 /DNA_START=25 /DNA_END=1674 /DNA_ORIENTATION=+ /assembly_acc=CAM_ASM_000147